MPRARSHDASSTSVSAVPDRDYDERVTFLNHEFRLVRLGTGGDVAPRRGARPVTGPRTPTRSPSPASARHARPGSYDGELARHRPDQGRPTPYR